MITPRVATKIDQRLNPVAPVPPRMPTTNPPTTAPAIPMESVTMKPPGSSPGMTSLPKAPAIRLPTGVSKLSSGRPDKRHVVEFRVSPRHLLGGVSLSGCGPSRVGVDERVEGASGRPPRLIL